MERKIDYGLDGPGVVLAFGLTGAFILVFVMGGALGLQGRPLPIVRGILILGATLAAYCFANALLMVWSSRVGKFFMRNRLVEALHLNGGERVLDVGCGRGLVLIEVAKRLESGRATGVDLWLPKDLTGNRPNLTLDNANAAGVADRVTVETGDMCALPFTTSTFDAVTSMTAIHNVPGEARRELALSEMARVLKPGGRLAIFDVFYSLDYARVLRGAGWDVETSRLFLLWGVPGRCVFAHKPSNSGCRRASSPIVCSARSILNSRNGADPSPRPVSSSGRRRRCSRPPAARRASE